MSEYVETKRRKYVNTLTIAESWKKSELENRGKNRNATRNSSHELSSSRSRVCRSDTKRDTRARVSSEEKKKTINTFAEDSPTDFIEIAGNCGKLLLSSRYRSFRELRRGLLQDRPLRAKKKPADRAEISRSDPHLRRTNEHHPMTKTRLDRPREKKKIRIRAYVNIVAVGARTRESEIKIRLHPFVLSPERIESTRNYVTLRTYCVVTFTFQFRLRACGKLSRSIDVQCCRYKYSDS